VKKSPENGGRAHGEVRNLSLVGLGGNLKMDKTVNLMLIMMQYQYSMPPLCPNHDKKDLKTKKKN
jgi:hypothetical protein